MKYGESLGVQRFVLYYIYYVIKTRFIFFPHLLHSFIVGKQNIPANILPNVGIEFSPP